MEKSISIDSIKMNLDCVRSALSKNKLKINFCNYFNGFFLYQKLSTIHPMLQSIYLISVEGADYKLLAQENFHIMQVQNEAKILEHSKIIKFLNLKKSLKVFFTSVYSDPIF